MVLFLLYTPGIGPKIESRPSKGETSCPADVIGHVLSITCAGPGTDTAPTVHILEYHTMNYDVHNDGFEKKHWDMVFAHYLRNHIKRPVLESDEAALKAIPRTADLDKTKCIWDFNRCRETMD